MQGSGEWLWGKTTGSQQSGAEGLAALIQWQQNTRVLHVAFDIPTVIKSPENGCDVVNSREFSGTLGVQLSMYVCMHVLYKFVCVDLCT